MPYIYDHFLFFFNGEKKKEKVKGKEAEKKGTRDSSSQYR